MKKQPVPPVSPPAVSGDDAAVVVSLLHPENTAPQPASPCTGQLPVITPVITPAEAAGAGVAARRRDRFTLIHPARSSRQQAVVNSVYGEGPDVPDYDDDTRAELATVFAPHNAAHKQRKSAPFRLSRNRGTAPRQSDS
ncbi:hypothetical protein [Oleidesulfovibrio alaskensis]|jgi:hypothetical protein|uniref:hypothetical protein n=1 Tax=Oleidesulfovibrio alaskensis TaxID=58180 RepID=UPI001A5062D2|nr:hypothetical protein [Oleidesulfovibrio alaskensis]MBL3582486.1 hypothetical protein [Oleidesulfovibrio alaskensis]